jgi:hypothetical protein
MTAGLILKRAPIGSNQEGYDVLADGNVAGASTRTRLTRLFHRSGARSPAAFDHTVLLLQHALIAMCFSVPL